MLRGKSAAWLLMNGTHAPYSYTAGGTPYHRFHWYGGHAIIRSYGMLTVLAYTRYVDVNTLLSTNNMSVYIKYQRRRLDHCNNYYRLTVHVESVQRFPPCIGGCLVTFHFSKSKISLPTPPCAILPAFFESLLPQRHG